MKEMFCARRTRIDHRRHARAEGMVIGNHTESFRFAGMVGMDVNIDQARSYIAVGHVNDGSGLSRVNIRGDLCDSGTGDRYIHPLINLISGIDDMTTLEQ